MTLHKSATAATLSAVASVVGAFALGALTTSTVAVGVLAIRRMAKPNLRLNRGNAQELADEGSPLTR